MQFDFSQLVAHVARTRPLVAGTIVGSGTIANEDTSLGASCFAEKRTVETLEQGKPVTPFMSFGHTVRIEMLDGQGNTIFGALQQRIERQPVPAECRRHGRPSGRLPRRARSRRLAEQRMGTVTARRPRLIGGQGGCRRNARPGNSKW